MNALTRKILTALALGLSLASSRQEGKAGPRQDATARQNILRVRHGGSGPGGRLTLGTRLIPIGQLGKTARPFRKPDAVISPGPHFGRSLEANAAERAKSQW